MSRLTKVVSIHANEPEFYEANIDLYPEMMGYEHQQAEMDCINKLGQLEDIEEELGIDLITYFKIKVGIKVYTNLLLDDDLIIDNIFGSGKDICYHIVPRNSRSGVYVKLDEYGRNWSLTKEELL